MSHKINYKSDYSGMEFPEVSPTLIEVSVVFLYSADQKTIQVDPNEALHPLNGVHHFTSVYELYQWLDRIVYTNPEKVEHGVQTAWASDDPSDSANYGEVHGDA